MEVHELLKKPLYKDICKVISNNHDLWEDLYQDFCLKLLENKLRSFDSSRDIDGYCFFIIKNIWRDKYCSSRGSQFRQLSDEADEIIPSLDYNKQDRQVRDSIDELYDSVNKEIIKLKKSNNPSTLKSIAWLEQIVAGKNKFKISKETGVNYRIIHESIDKITDQIKSNMSGKPTKQDINIKLSAEKIKASYSGKTQTFYVSGEPSDKVKELITKAGLKYEKK